MAERDLYATLGVPRDADEDAIRTAYRKLARKHHPDVNPNDPKAEDRFKEVSFANQILSDPEKRKLYDEFGMQGLEGGFDPERAREYQRWAEGARRSPGHDYFESDLDMEDLLSGLFGGARQRGPQRGRDARGEITVDFLDAVRGGEVRVQFEGRGRLAIRIPPGADDGTRIRLAGQGEPGSPGAPKGDLFLTLRVRPHPFFERSGEDLHLDVPATVPELLLGATIDVPTPDGLAETRIPPRSRSGQRLRLKGKGATRAGGGRGDLIVRLVPELPEVEDAEARARLEEIAEEMKPLYGDRDVRAKLRGSGFVVRYYTRKEILEIVEIDEGFFVCLEQEEIVGADAPEAPGQFSERMLERARVARTLVEDLDVNLPGAAVIVRMREEIAALRRRLEEIVSAADRSRRGG